MRHLLLNEFDRALVAALEFFPERTHHEIARLLRTKSTTVAYRIERLKEKGIIRRSAILNHRALGFTNVAVYFSLRASTDAAFKKLVADIVSHQRVGWFGSLAGDFQFGLAYLTDQVGEVVEFMARLADKHHMMISQKEIVPRIAMHCFPRSYLARGAVSSAKPRPFISMKAAGGERARIDALDGALLWTICNTPWRSVRQLAEGVKSSSATVDRRIKRLHDEGIVARWIYAIDSDALGVSSYRVLVGTERLEHSLREAIFGFCYQHPQVLRMFEGVGSWDFEIDVEAGDPREIHLFTQQLDAAANGAISRLRVFSELEDFKFSFYPLRA